MFVLGSLSQHGPGCSGERLQCVLKGWGVPHQQLHSALPLTLPGFRTSQPPLEGSVCSRACELNTYDMSSTELGHRMDEAELLLSTLFSGSSRKQMGKRNGQY